MDNIAVAQQYFVDHARRGRNQIHVVFALETLLHNIHVQQPEKARSETETERLRNFRFKVQSRVVKLQLRERIAKRFVLV